MAEPLTTGAVDETAAAGSADEPVAEPSRWRLALKLSALSLVAVFLGLLTWGLLAAGRGNSLVAKVAAGKTPAAPAFDLGVLWRQDGTWPPAAKPTLSDGALSLAELRGYPVVLNFWASWCIPCRQEAPVLRAGAITHSGEVAFLGLDVQDLHSDALGFLRKFRVNYVSVRDRGDKEYRAYGLTGVPETYFIDARGRAVGHFIGAISTEALEAGIAAITKPGGPAPGQLGRGPHVSR